jgi:type II secretory pathway component PulM
MRAMLAKLSLRERWLVGGAGVFVMATLIFTLVINPVVESRDRYVRLTQTTRQDLIQFSRYAVEYRSLQASLEQLERQVAARSSDLSLLAAMENNARKLGMADKIASMKPFTSELESGMVQSSVEMRVEKIDLSTLVRYIEAIESGPLMAVTTRLRIKTRFDDPALLDGTLLVTTLEKR